MELPWRPQNETLKDTAIFLSIFAILSITLHVFVWININTTPLQQLLAQAVTTSLQLLGITAQVNGSSVVVANFGIVNIIRECLGWKSMLAFTALIIATRKKTPSVKVRGIVYGNIALIGLNIIRIVTTIIIVMSLGVNFTFVHSVLWQWSLAIGVLGVWGYWLFQST